MTSNLELRTDYRADGSARKTLISFLREMFQVDLEPWNASGYWDLDYRPFSFFAPDGRIVANACLYSMRMVIAGRRVRVGQISGMGVLPEYRRQGLGRRLAETAMQWASKHGHESFMLFSTEEGMPFYRSRGFTLTPEHWSVLLLSGTGAPAASPGTGGSGLRPLDMALSADRDLLFNLACKRAPVSQELGVLNDRLLLYHATVVMRGGTCYIPPLDAVVFYRRQEGVLKIYDVIGSRMPAFSELAPFLLTPADREVIFWFQPDLLGDLSPFGTLEYRPLVGNNLHLQAPVPIPGPFVFPFTAQA